MHIPNIEKLGKKYRIRAIVNRSGHKAKNTALHSVAEYCTTNYADVLSDPDIDLVLISTRHDSHTALTLQALQAGKHVFVEKPLATNEEELKDIEGFFNNESTKPKPVLFTGFNRRFSTYATEIKKRITGRKNPLFIQYRMNAGYIPRNHWVHENGGRIVGECCHLIDLMTFFTESKIESISYESISPESSYFSPADNKSVILRYKDGSVCTIGYFSMGNKNLPKEYMELHFDNKSIVMNDYKSLTGYGVHVKRITTVTSQKGHIEELERLHETLSGKTNAWPIELWDMLQTTRATFMIR
jgi:predicted dehydrogenase